VLPISVVFAFACVWPPAVLFERPCCSSGRIVRVTVLLISGMAVELRQDTKKTTILLAFGKMPLSPKLRIVLDSNYPSARALAWQIEVPALGDDVVQLPLDIVNCVRKHLERGLCMCALFFPCVAQLSRICFDGCVDLCGVCSISQCRSCLRAAYSFCSCVCVCIVVDC
jgi:hypothetical protein